MIVTELVLDDPGAGPLGAALMGVNMLVGTLRGRSYTESEHRAALDCLLQEMVSDAGL